MKALMKRSEADPEYCWTMKDMFASEELWEKEYNALTGDINKISE